MKFRKNSGSKKREKSLEISRFPAVWLAKRIFPSFGSKLTCHHGWGSWIRTNEVTESESVALPLGDTPIICFCPASGPSREQLFKHNGIILSNFFNYGKRFMTVLQKSPKKFFKFSFSTERFCYNSVNPT